MRHGITNGGVFGPEDLDEELEAVEPLYDPTLGAPLLFHSAVDSQKARNEAVDRFRHEMGMLAAYGQAMSNGGVLGAVAAGVPFLEVGEPIGDEEWLDGGDGSLREFFDAEWDDSDGHWRLRMVPVDFPGLFDARELDHVFDPERYSSSHVAAAEAIYAAATVTPDTPEWGQYVANKYLARIRAELGLESYSIDKVRPLLEEAIDAETLLFEVNAEIGHGVFNGLKPSAHMESVDPLPVANTGGQSYWAHSNILVGMTQKQYDALAAKELEAVQPEPIDTAIAVVVGDMNDAIAARIADSVSQNWTQNWAFDATLQRLTLAHDQARVLVDIISAVCRNVSADRVRRALSDLVADDKAWEHFEPPAESPVDAIAAAWRTYFGDAE